MVNYSKIAGRNLKLLLDRLNLTQEDAANLISVDDRTIRRWIKQGIDRLSTLETIAEKLDVDVITTFLQE